MKKLLLGLLLAASSITGFTAPQAGNGRDFVILREQACTNPAILAHIPAEMKPDFLQAEVLLKGVEYKPCWTVLGRDVILVYPDGDQGSIPIAAFKEAGV